MYFDTDWSRIDPYEVGPIRVCCRARAAMLYDVLLWPRDEPRRWVQPVAVAEVEELYASAMRMFAKPEVSDLASAFKHVLEMAALGSRYLRQHPEAH